MASRVLSSAGTGSNAGVIEVDTVREALEQVFGILGSLQTQIEGDARKASGKEHSEKASVVGMQWYVEKCNALDEMTRKYRVKCQEYEQLLARYNRLQVRKPEQVGRQGLAQQMQGRVATFDDIDEIEEQMRAPGSARAKRTSAGLLVSPARGGCRGAMGAAGPAAGATTTTMAVPAEEETPTKKARPSLLDGGIGDLFSSPTAAAAAAAAATAANKPAGPKTGKRSNAAKMPLVLVHSSQETQLDFSDPCFANEHAVKLCPDSDEEEGIDGDGDGDKVMWTSPVRQPSKPSFSFRLKEQEAESGDDSERDSGARRRLLEAAGVCDECKKFYSVPELALPKTDLSLLCAHNRSGKGKGKGKGRNSDQDGFKAGVHQTPSHESTGDSRSSRKPTPKSEQRLQSTPDHFWDISFFPDIKTAGPELLRKSKR